MRKANTIAAISTPVGAGGIAMVRVSGPGAPGLARLLFRPGKPGLDLQSHHMHHGHIIDPRAGTVVDEVLACLMMAPATYTREDILEIHCHGGPVVAARILDMILDAGASLAQPGEFTRRAFLAGRLDLTQAEAVAELIAARGQIEANLAANQLAGGLSLEIGLARQGLIGILAGLEVALDFPEESSEIMEETILDSGGLKEVLGRLERLLADYQRGRVFREGVTVVIAGRPNVGKSSLLNALARRPRAIVTPLPGTTRDLIEAPVVFQGIPVTLVDTAGLEAMPGDLVEAEGQRRARARMAEADLTLLVMDAGRDPEETDLILWRRTGPGPRILVLNKVDLPLARGLEGLNGLFDTQEMVRVSALSGLGLESLEAAVARVITGGLPGTGVPEVVPNLRQRQALIQAREAVVRAQEGWNRGLAPELLALEIREALDHLGLITGATTREDVLDEIFGRFCLGK